MVIAYGYWEVSRATLLIFAVVEAYVAAVCPTLRIAAGARVDPPDRRDVDPSRITDRSSSDLLASGSINPELLAGVQAVDLFKGAARSRPEREEAVRRPIDRSAAIGCCLSTRRNEQE